MASRILDMGDLLTLIEQAEKVFERDQAEEMANKLATGRDFTLEDFLTQLQAIQKMGSIGKLLGMLPGMGEHREAINNLDEREFDKIRAIISSMTPAERADVKVLNASRRQRSARGSGPQVSDVNQLTTRFLEARKMMSQMAKGGGMPGMPGVPGMAGLAGGLPGGGGSRPKKGRKGQSERSKKGKKGRVSGNPAKRAKQLAQQETGQQPGQAAGSGRDAATDPAAAEPDSLGELPDAFTDLLGR
jgi:signal recognition particle subunit SRP54